MKRYNHTSNDYNLKLRFVIQTGTVSYKTVLSEYKKK